MAFADFTFHKSHAGLLAAIDASTPLVGSGSLHLSNAGDDVGASSVVHGYYSAGAHGFRVGRVRTLLQAQGGGGLPNGFFGVVCMQSQLDLSSTTGSAYVAALRVFDADSSGDDDYVATLRKTTAGLLGIGASDTVLATSGGGAWVEDTVVALQLAWEYNAAYGPGTRLVLSLGTQADFSDLAEILDVTDVSTPLAVSAAEGLVLRKVGTFGDVHEARFDETTIVQLA